jgi:hypothetical protein
MVPLSASDRPRKCERGPDCLVLFLIDFLFLELSALTSDEFASWMGDIAECLWILNETDRHYPSRPFKSDWWLEQVIHHIFTLFPKYPGGVDGIRLDLVRLMLAAGSDRP